MEIQKRSPKRGKKLQVFLLLAGIFLLGGIYLQGVTFPVNTTNDTVDANPGDGTAADSGGNCSLRAAIMEANALPGADTITIPAGTYTLTISGANEDNCAGGDLDVRSNLTINGAGPNATIIDGDDLDRVFHIRGAWTVTITNLKVQNGRTPDGETVTSSSSLEAWEIPSETKLNKSFDRTFFTPRRGEPMRGFSGQESSSLNKSFDQTFLKVRYADGPRRKTQWGRHPAGSPEARKKNNFMIEAASATDGGYGGGILNRYGTLTVNNCKIVNNATGDGGDYLIYLGPGECGDGGDGGGICNLDGTVVINDSVVEDNATGDGGNDSADMYGGSGGDGGGLSNFDGTMTLNNCSVQNNACGHYGVGYERDGSGGSGGGISNRHSSGNTGTLTVTDCTIRDNSTGDGGWTDGDAGSGGGIDNTGTALVENCLIHQNSCGEGAFDGLGGGICNFGSIRVFNSTISANSYGDTSETYGGGLFNAGITGFALLESCTVTGNNHDGICNSWPDNWVYGTPPICVLKIHNTIAANNLLSAVLNDCVGKIKSTGYNLIEGPSTIYYSSIVGNTTGNIIGSDPNLGALANNGGPTQTFALLGGSPCIDTGDPGDYEDTDQRGVLRPKDGNGDATALPDIGAYEKFSPLIVITAPLAGAKVCGTVLIEADTNTRYVDFKIDGVLLQTVDGGPHTCSWDTSTQSNGNHTIKAVGSDSPGGSTVQDRITVKVDNTIIALSVSRHEESAWLIRKQYGKVMFTVQHTGKTAPTAYQIERKEAGGTTFSLVEEVTGAEMGGASYTYYDPLPNTITSYTYRVTAVDSGGVNVGRSGEQTI
ncbi:MAG: CSLREA domain-containing protein [Candidatus Aminicenantes bacterium]|nr:CSLREA domain-containing protein [Candidatus Aminicenantes bacterium]